MMTLLLCEVVKMGPFCLCEVMVEDWFKCCTLSLILCLTILLG